ncbi:MAG: HD domain-containing phosphohydrolase [Acidimicrobiales bacterium]
MSVDDGTSPMRSARYLTEYLGATHVGFAYFDERGVVRDCNEAIANLLHTTVDQLLGLSVRTITRVDIATPFTFDDPDVAQTFDASQVYRNVVVGFVFAEHPRCWLSIDSYPVIESGRVRGVVVTFTDVTARRTDERMLRLLAEVTRSIPVASDEEAALQSVVDALCTVGGFLVSWVSRATDSGAVVTQRAGLVDYLDGLVFEAPADDPIWSGPTLRALRGGTTIGVEAVQLDPEFAPWRERASRFGVESFLAVPLSLGHRRATLTVGAPDKFAFSTAIEDELRALVAEIELLVAHVRTRAELERSLRGTVGAMVRLIEIRDPYTAGHQARVSALSRQLAERLHWCSEDVDAVASAAALHDVGKIAIPSEILGRPGPLSALEFEAVARHAELGAEIVEEASLSPVFVDVARHHHERLDGSGYPDHLVDGAISPFARLVAVADVVEAMVHHRPYRPAWSLADAREELRRGSGVRYDPEVVDACIGLIDEGFTFASTPPSGVPIKGLTSDAGTA